MATFSLVRTCAELRFHAIDAIFGGNLADAAGATVLAS